MRGCFAVDGVGSGWFVINRRAPRANFAAAETHVSGARPFGKIRAGYGHPILRRVEVRASAVRAQPTYLMVVVPSPRVVAVRGEGGVPAVSISCGMAEEGSAMAMLERSPEQ